jgi:ABC-type antimicrobial peptide transport system permease subunit
MIARDDLVSAFRHFARNKFRTGLAALGIAASVASIIVMVGVADAMRRDKMSYFEEAGARIAEVVLLDQRGLEMVSERPHEFGFGTHYRYDSLDYKPIRDWRDADSIKQACSGTVQALSPIVFNATWSELPIMKVGNVDDGIRVYGVTDDFFNCVAAKPVAGRPISREDMESERHVAVTSWSIQWEYLAMAAGGPHNPDYEQLEALYGSENNYDAIPKSLVDEHPVFRLNDIQYEVIGLLPANRPVLEPFFRWNWNLFVPFPCERELTKKGATNRLIFYPKGTAEEAFAQLKPVLEEAYPGSTAVLHAAEAWAEQERKSLGATTTGFVVIGIGTLIVAAVVVMNTMLVSVRERRLEIGLCKALGASQAAIRRQFRNETIILSAVGVVVGVAFAFGLAWIVELTQGQYLIPLLKAWRDKFATGAGGYSMEPRAWDIQYGTLSVVALIAATTSVAVAFLASLMPAREAARMHPVDCLRNTSAQLTRKTAPRTGWTRSAWARPFTEDPERTWLAVSAMAVGVAVVIVLTSVGEFNRLRSAEWSKFVGTDAVTFQLHAVGGDWKEMPTFDLDFAKRLEDECPHITDVWIECWAFDEPPSLRSAAVTIDDQSDRSKYRIWGADAVPAGMFDFYPGLKVKAGSDITQEEVDNRVPVCILDDQAASVLFPEGDALGNTLEIGGQAFTVKGIMANVSPFEKEPWGGARIPYTFNRAVLKEEGARWLVARTTDPEQAREEMAVMYESVYKTELRERKSHFTMIGEEQAVAQKRAWLHAALIMALGVGTLIVGGVGMMNTMLISMTARIGELGILRALGATRSRVIGQFLFEAAVLSLGGGLLGLVAGIVMARYGLPLLYLVWDQDELWPTALSVHWPVLALAFALCLGLASALVPALKASFIRPAEALRYE